MTLDELYRSGKMGRGHYVTYQAFVSSDFGAEWFDEMIFSTFLEETPPLGEHAFAYYCGRISMLRHIKKMIEDVKILLEENK